jgi:hypothetical protein
MTIAFLVAATVLGTMGAILVLAGLAALLRRRPLRFTVRTLAGLLLLVLGVLVGGLGVGLHGYRALTHEEVAAHVFVRPTGPQRFMTMVRFPDGRQDIFEVAGDAIYVDAHILKWKPLANLMGLHTAYELDRLAGRYESIEHERTAPRTIHALGPDRPVDLFSLRRRYAFLAPLLDAEYGSATFVPVTRPGEFEVRVSTTGLLMREVTAHAGK